MYETLCWELSTTITQESGTADHAAVSPFGAASVTIMPDNAVERIGIYVIDDDLPSADDLVDDGEYELLIANSRVKA